MDRCNFLMGCGAALSCAAWGGPMAAASFLLMLGGLETIVRELDSSSSSTMRKILVVAGGSLAMVASAYIILHAAPLMFGAVLPLELAVEQYFAHTCFIGLFGCVAGLIAEIAVDVFQQLRLAPAS